jgi:ribosomal protein L33
MSQDNLIKLESEVELTDKQGNPILDRFGKPKKVRHVYMTHKNKRKFKGGNGRLELMKYNPLVGRHTLYKETKK